MKTQRLLARRAKKRRAMILNQAIHYAFLHKLGYDAYYVPKRLVGSTLKNHDANTTPPKSTTLQSYDAKRLLTHRESTLPARISSFARSSSQGRMPARAKPWLSYLSPQRSKFSHCSSNYLGSRSHMSPQAGSQATLRPPCLTNRTSTSRY